MLEVVTASEKDCQRIADYANEILCEYDVATWRDAKYYKTLLSELVSEGGDIILIKKESLIEGVFCYARGEQLQLHEPLFNNKEILQHAIYHLTGNETDSVLCTGYGSKESKPIIMAKVLNPEFDFDLKNAKVFINEVV